MPLWGQNVINLSHFKMFIVFIQPDFCNRGGTSIRIPMCPQNSLAHIWKKLYYTFGKMVLDQNYYPVHWTISELNCISDPIITIHRRARQRPVHCLCQCWVHTLRLSLLWWLLSQWELNAMNVTSLSYERIGSQCQPFGSHSIGNHNNCDQSLLEKWPKSVSQSVNKGRVV